MFPACELKYDVELKTSSRCMIHLLGKGEKQEAFRYKAFKSTFQSPSLIARISSSLFDCRRRPSARPPTEPLFRVSQFMLKTPLLRVLLKLIPYIQALHSHNTEQLPIVTFPRCRGNNATVRTDKKLRRACPHAIPIDGTGGFDAEGACSIRSVRSAVQPAEATLAGPCSEFGWRLLGLQMDFDPAAVTGAVIAHVFRLGVFLCPCWAICYMTPLSGNVYGRAAVHRLHRPCSKSRFDLSA